MQAALQNLSAVDRVVKVGRIFVASYVQDAVRLASDWGGAMQRDWCQHAYPMEDVKHFRSDKRS
jgi:hypothetical protein